MKKRIGVASAVVAAAAAVTSALLARRARFFAQVVYAILSIDE